MGRLTGMNLASDNVCGAAPAILEALVEGTAGPAMPYGGDPVTAEVEAALKEAFETDRLVAYPVLTGTAANALALACVTPAWGNVYAHEESHVANDECGATELMSGGCKVTVLPGTHGRIAPETLADVLARAGAGVARHNQPSAVSLTNLTEAGTVYRPDEVARLAEIAHAHGCAVHMDGARFANALVAAGVSPAEMTWRAGVDILSFGGTKNGCLAAEAVVFFKPELARDFPYRRQRAGHGISKARTITLQLRAYLKDRLWLRLAAHANAQMARLAAGLAELPGVELVHPAEGNEVFALIPTALIEALFAEGLFFYRMGTQGERELCRLVTAFDTDPAGIESLLAVAREAAGVPATASA